MMRASSGLSAAAWPGLYKLASALDSFTRSPKVAGRCGELVETYRKSLCSWPPGSDQHIPLARAPLCIHSPEFRTRGILQRPTQPSYAAHERPAAHPVGASRRGGRCRGKPSSGGGAEGGAAAACRTVCPTDFVGQFVRQIYRQNWRTDKTAGIWTSESLSILFVGQLSACRTVFVLCPTVFDFVRQFVRQIRFCRTVWICPTICRTSSRIVR